MPDMPPTPSHQTVRLSRGRHRSSSAGVCVMELASMLADEPFSDRSKSMSPCIGAFLRTYNDGLDDGRRQELYPLASAVVGTVAPRRVERERVWRCLSFARRYGGSLHGGRAALSLASPEAAGTLAARAILMRGPTPRLHAIAMDFVDELIALGDSQPSRAVRWPLRADPGASVANALDADADADADAEETAGAAR